MPYVGQTITDVFPTSISVDSATVSSTLGVTGATTLSSSLAMTSDDPTITMTDSSGTNDIGTIQATSGALILTARDGSSDGEIIFKKTDGSATDESMRIDSSGKLLVGTTSALGDGLSLMPRYSESGTTSQIRWNRANVSGSGVALVFQNNSSTVGSISHNNSSTAYNTSSDYRLKENVDYTFDATTRLKQLKPARFNFIADTNTTVDGFLAHEVSSIVPEAISGEKDAVDDDDKPIYQGIDHSKIVPLLTKALQEQQATIEALTARITALESA